MSFILKRSQVKQIKVLKYSSVVRFESSYAFCLGGRQAIAVYTDMRTIALTIGLLLITISATTAQYFSISSREGINIPMPNFENKEMYSFPSLGVNVTLAGDYMFNRFVGIGVNVGYIYFYNNEAQATEYLGQTTLSIGSRSTGAVSGGDYHILKYTFNPLIGYTWEDIGLGVMFMPEIGGITIRNQQKDIEQYNHKRVQDIKGTSNLVYGFGGQLRYYIKNSYGIGLSLVWWQSVALERNGSEVLYDDIVMLRSRKIEYLETVSSFEGNIVLFYRF